MEALIEDVEFDVEVLGGPGFQSEELLMTDQERRIKNYKKRL